VHARDGGAKLEREQLLGGVVRDFARLEVHAHVQLRPRLALGAPHLRVRAQARPRARQYMLSRRARASRLICARHAMPRTRARFVTADFSG
jgi:hypothetical protein